MLGIGIAVVIAFVLQIGMSMLQMRHFSNEFVKLRRRGRVACGRKAGGFHAGAIVMFLIDDKGLIQDARKLEGVTCFARVRPLHGFEGRMIDSLTAEDGPRGHKNLGKAIEDASLTYRKYVAGEIIPDPPSPFQKAGHCVGNLFNFRKTVRQ